MYHPRTKFTNKNTSDPLNARVSEKSNTPISHTNVFASLMRGSKKMCHVFVRQSIS